MTSTRRPVRRSAPAGRGGPAQGARGRSRGATRDASSTDRSAALMVLVPVGILCATGSVMVYSASAATMVGEGAASWSTAGKQALFLLVGVAAAYGVTQLPLETVRRVGTPVLVLLSVAALLLLHVPGLPFAVSVNGATRWFAVGPLQFQPSELAKPALVLWLARLLDVHRERLADVRSLAPVIVAAGLLCGLVVTGDDLGTTALLGVVLLVMLYVAGAPGRLVGGLAGGAAGLGVALLLMGDGFRLQRILAFLHPERYRLAEAWQLHQSQIGLASGGLFGTGPGSSRAKWGYLGPEAHTDFILAVIGEEFGLLGTLVVIGCFAVAILGGLRIAAGARTQYGRLVAVGVTTWLGFQALINIGVSIGTFPTKGITLPFVSYGGTSMVVSLAGVGLLIAVARER